LKRQNLLPAPVANGFRESFQTLMADYFSPRSTINHYLGLTKRTLLDFGENPEVKLKKYFYILRPLMAARWITRRGNIPPMEFDALLAGSDFNQPVLSMIAALRPHPAIDGIGIIRRR
jgi:predicted nucleotidyltransferase